MNDLTEKQGKPYRFVWVWFVFTLGIGVVSLLLFMRNAATPVPASWGVEGGTREGVVEWINAFQQSLLSPTLIGFLGALILTRRPGHRIGRLLIALGVVSALGTFTQEWAVYGYYTLQTNVPGNMPGTALAAWITNWIWVILFGILLLTAAVFPDGRFLSSRWAWLVCGPLALFAVPILLGGAVETPMSSSFQMPNPFVSTHPKAFYDFVFTLGVIFMPLTALAVLAATFVRFRTSQARERQQMKWLMFGVAAMAFLTVVGLGLYFGLNNNFGGIMVNTAVIGPALGVGVALLRHRLYDIDILIRRTLQYSVLTGLLALVYFGSIVLLQSVFSSFGQQSEVVIVITTLGIAALFNPLRLRVQDFIDRRFYRKKYDAEQALAQFAAVARDEVDMDRLTAALIRVVEETVQPEKVSLWLVQGKNASNQS
ncbi:MAG: hypothetical protein Fur0022_03190 [Anaerolineales bacterium]